MPLCHQGSYYCSVVSSPVAASAFVGSPTIVRTQGARKLRIAMSPMSTLHVSKPFMQPHTMQHTLFLHIAGSTYNPDQGEVLGLPSTLDTCLTHLAEVCAACNDSKIECVEGTFRSVGAPTEASLKVGHSVTQMYAFLAYC
eukprot:GHUV01049447.1.p1 GENE.GHUV01049447.1~~GHUV01049447.1.p1  ORF type:complete len:141 (-),score=3.92 GHUV01049447.1:144-566(-)